jgi:hypothetical protein
LTYKVQGKTVTESLPSPAASGPVTSIAGLGSQHSVRDGRVGLALSRRIQQRRKSYHPARL